jgi:hypothetical protein
VENEWWRLRSKGGRKLEKDKRDNEGEEVFLLVLMEVVMRRMKMMTKILTGV